MLSAGTMLGGRYRLEERIAGGGMGDVWRGTDEVLGRTVAVKVLLPALLDEPGFAERFRGEARTMAGVNHPGVVDVYDYGSESGTAFLVMEYVEGEALSQTLSRVGRLTPGRTMALVAQAADALHAAHQKGIVHRDVKPGNLLVRPNGTLVLTDFGIARSAMVSQLTAVGSVLGTAAYISPEQAAGATASPLSDVYALGVVAYQCLSGRRPFEGDTPVEIAMRHVRDAPPPLPADIPPVVGQIVERALAKDPAARWPTAVALAQVARRASAQLAAGVTTSPVSGGPMGSSAMGGQAYGTTKAMPATVVGRQPARGTAGVPTGGYGQQPVLRSGRQVSPPPATERSSGLVAMAVVLALLLVALCVVGAVYYFGAGANPSAGAQSQTTSAPDRNRISAASVAIPCEDLQGKQRSVVEARLTKLGFTMRADTVDEGGRRDTVVSVPCGAPRGSEVRVRVTSGKARQPGGGAATTSGAKSGKASPSASRSNAGPSSSAGASASASAAATCAPGLVGSPLLGSCSPGTRQ